MKKYLQFGGFLVLVLWLLGILVFLNNTESALNDAAKKALTDRAFAQVRVEFSGQEATLIGTVPSQQAKDEAAAIVADKLLVPGWVVATTNPVTEVHNQLQIDVAQAPSPWLILTHFGGHQRVDGMVQTVAQRDALLAALAAKLPPPQGAMTNQVIPESETISDATWNATLAAIPDLKSTPKEQSVIALSSCNGTWTQLPADASSPAVAAALKLPALPDVEINRALRDLRAWKNPTPEELKQAADKAAAIAKAAKDRAEAEAAAEARAKAAQALAQRNPNPPYLGLTAAEGSIKLFGIIPTEADRITALEAAKKAYPTYQIDAAALTLDPTCVIDPGQTSAFPPVPAKDKPFVAMIPYGAPAKTYPSDVFNSEIAKDFPKLVFPNEELAAALNGFRTRLTSSGALVPDEPFLALITDGKAITLTGEVADQTTKDQIRTAITAANPGLPLADQLAVTTLVRPCPKLKPTLDSLPKLTPGQAAVATATPGQACRTAIVHSIHFPTGSDRSKDQERAIEQMLRVRTLIPTATFEIVGHTDNVGKPDANTKLSLERAQRFAAQATAAGLPADALKTRGAGPAEPLEPNNTPGGKALNRRIDVLLK